MLFNSLSFLASFAVFTVVYYSVPHRLRWPLLLIASLGFYATFNLSFLAPLIAVTLVAYGGGVLIDRVTAPRPRLAVTTWLVLGALAPLFVYKYFDFVTGALGELLAATRVPAGFAILPRLELIGAAGLSFYTFSAVSYLVDVHRRHIAPEKHLGQVALFLAVFPKLLAGPIERSGAWLAQARAPVAFDDARAVAGLQQMLWGLFKKVVIADRLAVFVDRAYAQPTFTPAADLVIATHLFAIQLYCDFSGYSDIAIGASRVLGFDLGENFRRPYLSTSVAEFWSRRWHLSLASWFRDYVYIPLGGNRVSLPRQALNVMVVFLLSGIWHGANWTFVAWGALNGLYQVALLLWRRSAATVGLPQLSERIATPVRRFATFYLILISWVFFRAASVSDAVTIFSRVGAEWPVLPGLLLTRLAIGDLTLAVILVGVLFIVEALDERRSIWHRLRDAPGHVRWAAYYALVLSLVVLGVWHVQQFVYMQF